ncbi:hypothetical protein F4804DRAFT_335119 [Jackrogersella minutella]|nr:hypothetical protein F4804DRAFT_335119 [Jackrogersella minutella]
MAPPPSGLSGSEQLASEDSVNSNLLALSTANSHHVDHVDHEYHVDHVNYVEKEPEQAINAAVQQDDDNENNHLAANLAAEPVLDPSADNHVDNHADDLADCHAEDHADIKDNIDVLEDHLSEQDSEYHDSPAAPDTATTIENPRKKTTYLADRSQVQNATPGKSLNSGPSATLTDSAMAKVIFELQATVHALSHKIDKDDVVTRNHLNNAIERCTSATMAETRREVSRATRDLVKRSEVPSYILTSTRSNSLDAPRTPTASPATGAASSSKRHRISP